MRCSTDRRCFTREARVATARPAVPPALSGRTPWDPTRSHCSRSPPAPRGSARPWPSRSPSSRSRFLGVAAALGDRGASALRRGQEARRRWSTGCRTTSPRRSRRVRRLTEQGQDLMVLVRHEAGAFAQTSRRVRRKLVRGVDRVEEQAGRPGDALRPGARRGRGRRARRGGHAPLGAPRQRHARAGCGACSWPAGHDARAPRARLRGRGARAPRASRRGPRLDAGHAHLSGRVRPREPGAAPGRRWPTCSAPIRSTSSTATSPPTPPSRSTTRPSAGIVTTGTWARRSTTWPRPTRSGPSGWAISAISPPTPSPTTTSCPASS